MTKYLCSSIHRNWCN